MDFAQVFHERWWWPVSNSLLSASHDGIIFPQVYSSMFIWNLYKEPNPTNPEVHTPQAPNPSTEKPHTKNTTRPHPQKSHNPQTTINEKKMWNENNKPGKNRAPLCLMAPHELWGAIEGTSIISKQGVTCSCNTFHKAVITETFYAKVHTWGRGVIVVIRHGPGL